MLQEVFDKLNIISSLPYEGAEAIGELLFARPDIEELDVCVHLKEPVPLHDYKLARKVIEMSSRDLLCICPGADGIKGFCTLPSDAAANLFRVTFTGHYKWDLYYKNKLLMRTAFGVPQLPSVQLSKEEFCSNVRRIFPGIDNEAQDRLWLIVEAAMQQRHGTMIVVSDRAGEEAKRLKKQSLGIEAIELIPSLVHRFSGIDGAILIDSKGICHAIGVILDGLATDEGDSSRGARYNSAVRYVASAKANTICLVVSEDGYVNMVPKLRPQVRKSDIESRIAALKTHDINTYHKTRNWLDEHRFYLTAEQSEVVNRELARIHSAPHADKTIRIVIPPFEPNPAMNDSYYLPESEL